MVERVRFGRFVSIAVAAPEGKASARFFGAAIQGEDHYERGS